MINPFLFMKKISVRLFCILSGVSGIIGVLMLIISFNINAGPPAGATPEQLVTFANQNYASILWGAWLQTVGPYLIVVFAFSLVSLSRATQHLAGWMVFFGAGILMTVSLIEITFYIAVLFKDPPLTSLIGLNVIYAVQHLYFIIGAPALFIPLGLVLLDSGILPKSFGFLAIFLGLLFGALGIVFLLQLVLPVWVTASAGLQALWWLAAAIALIARTGKISQVS